MAYALQQLINGISLGMIYGLIAVGYTMVYGIIGMINFAHGDVFMIGAFLALIAVLLLQLGGLMDGPAAILLVLLFSMAFSALYGWTLERVAYRPLRGSFRLAPLITAIGMSIVLQNYVQVSQGARVKPLEPLVPGGIEVFREGGFVVQLSYVQMLIVGVTLAVLAMFGARRCMFESNFPVDKGSYGYGVFWNACKKLVAGASATEKAALFSGTAAGFYKLDL